MTLAPNFQPLDNIKNKINNHVNIHVHAILSSTCESASWLPVCVQNFSFYLFYVICYPSHFSFSQLPCVMARSLPPLHFKTP